MSVSNGKLTILKDTFNQLRMFVLTDSQVLRFEFRKNLSRDMLEDYQSVREIEFISSFRLSFSKNLSVSFREFNDEQYIVIEVLLEDVTWDYINVESIECKIQSLDGVPEIFNDKFTSMDIPKFTEREDLKNTICRMNGIEFAPEYRKPDKVFEYIMKEENHQDVIDVSTLEIPNDINVVIFFGVMSFNLINVPQNWTEDPYYGDNINFYLRYTVDNKEEFNVKCFGEVEPNRNRKIFRIQGDA